MKLIHEFKPTVLKFGLTIDCDDDITLIRVTRWINGDVCHNSPPLWKSASWSPPVALPTIIKIINVGKVTSFRTFCL